MKKPMKSMILFASGQGSNIDAIIQYFQGNSRVDIALIVCNNPNAGVIELANRNQIPLRHITKQSFLDDIFLEQLKSCRPDLIVLAGFLWKIPEGIIQLFPNKMINLHPALLPKYGGKGMYGNHVHEAVKAAGEAETGITIHQINEHYDEGSILLQAHCKIQPADNPADIAMKVRHLEHFYLPRLIDFLLFPSKH